MLLRHYSLVIVGIVSLWRAAITQADEAAGVFDDLYGKQIEQVQTTTGKKDDLELAEKMLASARTADDQDLLILLCDKVYDLARTTRSGYATAIDAMRLLSERVPARWNRCREKMLSVYPYIYMASRGEDRIEAGRILSEMLEASADEKLEGDVVRGEEGGEPE